MRVLAAKPVMRMLVVNSTGLLSDYRRVVEDLYCGLVCLSVCPFVTHGGRGNAVEPRRPGITSVFWRTHLADR